MVVTNHKSSGYSWDLQIDSSEEPVKEIILRMNT